MRRELENIDFGKLVAVAGIAVTAIIAICSVAEYLGPLTTVFELMGHFHLIWLLLLAISFLFGLVLRSRAMIVIAGCAMVLCAAPIISLYIRSEKSVSQSHKIRILQMNLFGGKNHSYERALAVVNSTNPDIIGFSEVTESWLVNLKKNLKEYSFVLAEPRYGGIALFSRIPLQGEIRYFGSYHRPRIYCSVKGSSPFTLLFAHPVIPISRTYA